MAAVVEQAGSTSGGISATALSSMFQAIAGLRNTRAAVAMLGCFVAAVLFGGLMAALFGRFSAATYLLGGAVALVLAYTGLNAAGVLLMDQARGQPLRATLDALLYGLVCIPKVIVLAIGIALATLGLYLAIALLLFLCKVPWLGPVLFTVVFPLAVIVAGLTAFGLFFAFALSICAVWDGASISGAIAKAAAILRARLVETVALSLVVGVLASFVGAFVSGVLLFGFFPASAMSAAILGGYDTGGMGSILAGMGSMMGGYAVAGAVGAGVLWALAATLVLQVGVLGINLIYLRVSEGLDATATEQAIRARFDDARRKAGEVAAKAKEAAKEAGERARAQAEQAAAAAAARRAASAASAAEPPAPRPAAPPPAAAAACPKCAESVATDDLFCGNCGHKLK
ncbi:MAG: zinc ribbon domain-containing protein [Rubrivivax sp.]|nr:zinc ribbon domain-containing protein [Rubrivivax sp.]